MTKLAMLAAAKNFKLPKEFQRGTKSYDLLAAFPLVVLFGLGAGSRFHKLHSELAQFDFKSPDFLGTATLLSNISNLILTFLFIGLLLTRRPAQSGIYGMLPRIAAIVGTYLAFAILQSPAQTLSPGLQVFSTILEVSGTIFAVYSLAWLGRSVSMMAEARELVTAGPYSVVRHPLYLGEEVALLGVVIQYLSVWTVIIAAAQFAAQLYRMECEEDVLAKAFPKYIAYRSRVARIIPLIY